MKHQLLNFLCCSACKAGLDLSSATEVGGEVDSGILSCGGCGRTYPVIRSVPRFVPMENDAASFGFQWNQFSKTQLDSHTGFPLSRDRFFLSTGWAPDDLAGKTVLDVGCGAGRFAEIALSTGANVIALDYSSAVDACRRNLGPHLRLNVVQGDIYHLPFRDGSFDFVYCLGVLQHTPDVKQAFLSLPDQLRPGGRLVVDVYPKRALNALWPKYWLRPFTRRMKSDRLLWFVQVAVRLLLPVSRKVNRIPFVGRKLRYLIPVANYEGVYPLSEEQLREWAILDTFDMFAPIYDSPQSASTLFAWLQLAHLEEIEVFRLGHLVGRGMKIVRLGTDIHRTRAEQQRIRLA